MDKRAQYRMEVFNFQIIQSALRLMQEPLEAIILWFHASNHKSKSLSTGSVSRSYDGINALKEAPSLKVETVTQVH
jgi:hypothetical protein